MGVIKEFFLTILKSLNPDSLKDLSNRTLKESFQYVFSLVFIALAAMFLISIPKLMTLPDYFNEQFSNFDNLSIKIKTEMNNPVIITQNNPQIIIDTTGNITKLDKGNLLIQKDSISYRRLFKINQFNTTNFGNVLENKNKVTGIIILIIVLMFPMFLVIFYILNFAKYIILILLFTIISLGIIKILRYKLKIKQIVNIIVYSSTIMIILELISLPYNLNKYLLPLPLLFGISLYLIPLALFIIYFIIGFILTKDKDYGYY